MTFEDDLQRRFDSAHSSIELEPGSAGEIRGRARRKTRNRQVVMGVAALIVVLALGSIFLRLPDRSDSVDVASGGTTTVGARVDASDLTYLGAFMVPSGDWGDSRFAYGGQAATFFAAGDPSSSDGFDGSLFMSGHPTRAPGVAEVTIPAPMLHNGSSAGLPVADVLRPFADITGGRGQSEVGSVQAGGSGGDGSFRYSGLEVIDTATGPRLAWTIWQYQNNSNNIVPGHGHSSTDLRDPGPEGPWFLGDYDARATAGYIFDVPADFADQHLEGYRLLTGLQDRSASSDTSFGPPFFAFNAPLTAEPGDRTEVLPLAFYDGEAQALANFGRADTASGAEWISTSSGRSAVIAVGSRGLGEVHFGEPKEADCGISSGMHAGPYAPQVLFYDTEDFARLASGELEQWQLTPYLSWDPTEFLLPTCEWTLTAVSFDEQSKRLYVVQAQADLSQSEFSPVPVVHVFSLS